MLYRVTKKYARGSESPIGSYNTIQEAKQVIQTKLEQDALQKVEASYCLYEFYDLIEEFTQSQIANELSSNDESTSAGGQGNAQSFRPTPLSITPQPKGLPRSSWVDNDDKDDDGKDR